jgi:uncharacterized protein
VVSFLADFGTHISPGDGKAFMRFIVFVLLQISELSRNHPRLMISLFLLLAIAGFAAVPFLTMETDLISGVGGEQGAVALTKQNNDMFGEQDSLIIVLEFAESPGEVRLPFIKGLGEAVARIPGVRRVRYQFLDADDETQTTTLFRQFLAGMNDKERAQILSMLSPEGVREALRRNINRLFLTHNPYIQKHILEDPLELGQFASESMTKRVGSLSLGDLFLLIASPDSTLYLIQITPEFASHDIAPGKELMEKLNEAIPKEIASLKKSIPNAGDQFKDLKWRLTGRVVFQQESSDIFDRESFIILLCSFGLVITLLFSIYRSFGSVVLLMTPLAAGIGLNYGFMYLICNEINPVVMGATGVLLGLGTEYAEHLWGRIREELDNGASHPEAIAKTYAQTGPPVLLGALTGMLAFLSLCLSHQAALIQLGYLGASGLAFTLVSTLFLVPALAAMAVKRKKDYFPRIRVSFEFIAKSFQVHPAAVVALSALAILVSLYYAAGISYEKDLFKVFLARNMESTTSSEIISQKFHSDFSKPVYLSFDVDNIQEGLLVQRELDGIMEQLIDKYHQIASFDSISYLMSPDSIRHENAKALNSVVNSWPELESSFQESLRKSNLSDSAAQVMLKALGSTKNLISSLDTAAPMQDDSEFAELERSWYMTKIKDKYRFLTHVRYSDTIKDPQQLKAADIRLVNAVRDLPVPVRISGARQAMEEILSDLVSELFRLGVYAFGAVVLIFLVVFPQPRGVALCLIPMVGAFCITLGVLGFTKLGLPFSIVCVAPLIFGFGIHNGMHIVMGSLFEEKGSIAKATKRVTPRAMVTSLTIIMGFVSMLSSRLYPLEFLGAAMVIGMVASVPLTLITLPAVLLLLERRKNTPAADTNSPAMQP